MELSETNFDIDLDLHDKLIPWLNRVPSALHLSCIPIPGLIKDQVEQSSFNDSSHTIKEEFVCEICQKAFTSKCYLTTHKRTHEFAFTRTNNIIPIQDIHPPPTDLERQQGHCQRPFCQTGQNRYICTICGKHFSSMRMIKDHQKIHTGIGLHCCRFCQKSFTNMKNWKVWINCIWVFAKF